MDMSRDRRTQPIPFRQIFRFTLRGLLLVSSLLLPGTAAAASGTTGISIRITGWPLSFGSTPQALEVPTAAVVSHVETAIEAQASPERSVALLGANGAAGVGSSATARVPASEAAGDSEGDVLVLLSWE